MYCAYRLPYRCDVNGGVGGVFGVLSCDVKKVEDLLSYVFSKTSHDSVFGLSRCVKYIDQ